MLRALSDAAAADGRVEIAYRTVVEEFIAATADHIREEQERRRIRAALDVEETARVLIWLDERYLTDTLGRTARADPSVVADML